MKMQVGPKKVLLFPEEGGWIAQCLEHDIVAQGANVKEAKERLVLTVVCQIVVDLKNGKRPLEGIDKAPQRYWEQFEEGHRLEHGHRNELLPGGMAENINELLPEDMAEDINELLPEDMAEDMRIYA